jgi:hypothetical protein
MFNRQEHLLHLIGRDDSRARIEGLRKLAAVSFLRGLFS